MASEDEQDASELFGYVGFDETDLNNLLLENICVCPFKFGDRSKGDHLEVTARLPLTISNPQLQLARELFYLTISPVTDYRRVVGSI